MTASPSSTPDAGANWSGGTWPERPGQRGFDRRGQATPRFSRYSMRGGRRRKVRREEEREGSFVDLYGAQTLVLIMWVAVLNAADSFFTIHHLQAGGIELNPVAAAMLDTGREGFVLAKAAMISVALLVLCMHKNFLLARLGLLASIATYSALVIYHIWLL
ncbi:MAG: DUF5658 family protein [bacterium]|jgi:hypothetical protein|nr:hypothetical protein [Planctomycetota bacterium]HIL53117.1 hypothetical protein [Planctomycetota bacterium]